MASTTRSSDLMASLPLDLDVTVTLPIDASLLARVRSGDHRAVAELYRAHGRPLLSLARRLTGSREDAEEVVQDVFVGLPLALRRYEECGRFDAWLRRLTARVALSRLRRSARRQEVALEDDDRESASTETRLFDALALEEAIAALPDTLRTVFVLREIEHFTHAEIGELLGIRRGTSEVRLYRAIRLLRERLGDAR